MSLPYLKDVGILSNLIKYCVGLLSLLFLCSCRVDTSPARLSPLLGFFKLVVAKKALGATTLRPEDTFVLAAPMFQDIPELSLFQRLQLCARPPQQQIISDLCQLVHSLIFPQIHNGSYPPAWVVMNRDFLASNSNNQVFKITTVTTNQHVQIMRL